MSEPTIPGMQVQFVGPEPEIGGWINADDVMAHVKTLDVALNGPGGAARPLLIDVVSQMDDIARKLGRPIVEAQNWPASVDRNQIIYALERAQRGLSAKGDELASAGDYGAEFYSEDADRMKEAIALITEGMLGIAPAPAELSEKVQLIKSGLLAKIHAFVRVCQQDPLAICGVPAFALQAQVERALKTATQAGAADPNPVAYMIVGHDPMGDLPPRFVEAKRYVKRPDLNETVTALSAAQPPAPVRAPQEVTDGEVSTALVRMGIPDFKKPHAQMRATLENFVASRLVTGALPAVDYTTLGAAMRAIRQVIQMIDHAPDHESEELTSAVRRVLRGAVVIAEDAATPAGAAPVEAEVVTCDCGQPWGSRHSCAYQNGHHG